MEELGCSRLTKSPLGGTVQSEQKPSILMGRSFASDGDARILHKNNRSSTMEIGEGSKILTSKGKESIGSGKRLPKGSVSVQRCGASEGVGQIMNPWEQSASKTVGDQKVHIQTAFSMMQLENVCKKLNGEKKEIVEDLGFGSLLRLPTQTMFPRQIVLWLLTNMDTTNGALVLPNNTIIPFSERDVQLVLGIPRKGKFAIADNVSYTDVTEKIRSVLMLRPAQDLNIKTIESILLYEYPRKMAFREKEAFKVAFVIYADACFLGPKGHAARINQDVLMQIYDPSSIPNINWCAYVVRVLLDSAIKVKQCLLNTPKSIVIEGCLFFLLVFYLDNLDFGPLVRRQMLTPRYRDYTCELVRRMVAEDRLDCVGAGIATFGRTKLRALDEVVYKRTWCVQESPVFREGDCNGTLSEVQVAHVMNEVDNWIEGVNKMTADFRSRLLHYFRCERPGSDSPESPMMHGRPNQLGRDWNDIRIRSYSSDGLPEDKRVKSPALMKFDAPDSAYRSGEDDVSEDYSISPEICVTKCVGHMSEIMDIGVTAKRTNENGNTRSQTTDDNNYGVSYGCEVRLSHDGVTNSEDSRLKYGIDGYPDYRSDMSQSSFNSSKAAQMDEQLRLDLEELSLGDNHQCGGSINDMDAALIASDGSIASNKQICIYIGNKQEELQGEILACNMDQKGNESTRNDGIKGPEDRILISDAYNNEEMKMNREICMGDPEMGNKLIGTCSQQGNELENAGQSIVTVYGVQFNAAHLHSSDRTGVSPFALDLTHQDAPFASVVSLYEALNDLTKEDKERTWFLHSDPKELRIEGGAIYHMFATLIDFNIKVINAIVRLYQSMDDDLYASYSEERCRHFLPYDFANGVLQGKDCAQDPTLMQMFDQYYIPYKIALCKMVIAPVLVECDWSLYVWNFDRRTIVILDPVTMVSGSEAVKLKHNDTVDKLHKAMTICKEFYFPYPNVSMQDWQQEFISIEGAHCDSSNSGFYTMFYARYFDGKTLTRILTAESQQLHKCNLLHQLLHITGNRGDLPESIKAAMMTGI